MSLFQVVYKIVPRFIGIGTTDSRQITNLRTVPMTRKISISLPSLVRNHNGGVNMGI